MIVHHLNCATMCPMSARLINGEGGFLEHAIGDAQLLLAAPGNRRAQYLPGL